MQSKDLQKNNFAALSVGDDRQLFNTSAAKGLSPLVPCEMNFLKVHIDSGIDLSGDSVKIQIADAFGCSMDVTPTLLGLIGRPYESMFFGRDLLKGKPENERVLMHHNRDAGMYRLERMVSLELNRIVQYYHGNPKKEELLPVTFPDKRDLETERYAVALFQTADDMYVHEQYRIDF